MNPREGFELQEGREKDCRLLKASGAYRPLDGDIQAVGRGAAVSATDRQVRVSSEPSLWLVICSRSL